MLTTEYIPESWFPASGGSGLVLLTEPHLSEENPVIPLLYSYGEAEPHPWDIHYALELGFISKGRIGREYHGHSMKLEPGQFWLCGACEPHGWEVLEPPCDVTILLIHPSVLIRQQFVQAPCFNLYAPFTAPPECRPQVSKERSGEAFLWHGRLLDLVHKERNHLSPVRLQLLLVEAILLLSEQWQPAGTQRTDSLAWAESISAVVQAVLGSQSPIQTTEAAHMCGMSRQSFDRIFSRLMGISFAQFELRHRVEGAAALLLQTDEPIKAIAHKWGFADASHLIRRFQEFYRCSPTEWRQNRDPAGATRY